MDPVSAIGLAAAAVQFISFASQLLTSTTEIHQSAVGASAEIASIEETYSELGNLALRLRNASSKAHASKAPISKTSSHRDAKIWACDLLDELAHVDIFTPHDFAASLGHLLSSCLNDCNAILTIVRKIKGASPSPTRWKSFRCALRMYCKKGDIEDIERRLARTQGMVALEISTISIEYHNAHLRELASLRRESQLLGIEQTKQLEAIDAVLQKMGKLKTDQTPQTPSLSAELSSLEKKMAQVSLYEDKISREHAILRSLSFQLRTARYTAIPEAHRETFQWVFSPEKVAETTSGSRWENLHTTREKFLKWLKESDGVFWISGKPGSGKSTFMKFIADHPATKAALSQWAGRNRMLIASYYFWSVGTQMQKSQQGLLQTLLFEILRCCPDLISVTCKSRWTSEAPSLQQSWELSELRASIRSLSLGNGQNYKFCFFIDGLDEYQGDHIDFCEDLVSLLSATNIKLCVSSRPWNVFEDAFGLIQEYKMYIHEVTRSDIFKYAQERLQRHPRWKLISTRSQKASSLIESITEKSRGVFLWVFIVTNLLREGLTNDDSFSDLAKRLDDFPADLEEFFKKILESVPAFYHQKMAGTLQLALAAREPLDALIYSLHDDEYDDPDYVINSWRLEPSDEEASMRREQIARRLNGRCRGLLEENMGRIDFLHRTVVDFLRTPDMSKFLGERVAPWFDGKFSIFKASVASFQLIGIDIDEIQNQRYTNAKGPLGTLIAHRIRETLAYAAEAELSESVSKKSLDSTITHLDKSITSLILTYLHERVGELGWDFRSVDQLPHLCRTIMLQRPLLRHLSRKLAEQPTYLSDFQPPALSMVLEPSFGHGLDWPVKRLELVKLLCFHNYSPNTRLGLSQWSTTIWGEFLFTMISFDDGPFRVSMRSGFLAALQNKLFAVLLKNGADPNIRLRMTCKKCADCPAVLALVLLTFKLPSDAENQAAYLQALELFIQNGAELGKLPLAESSLTLQGAINICEHESPQEVLMRHLKEAFKGKYDTPFLASVVRKVIPLALIAEWPIEEYIPEVLPLYKAPSEITAFRGSENFEAETKANSKRLLDACCYEDECYERKRVRSDAKLGHVREPQENRH